MEFSVGIGAFPATAGSKSRPLDGVFVAIAAFERMARGRQASFRSRELGYLMRRAKCVRGVPEACRDDLVFVWEDGVRRSWSLGPVRGELADKPEKAFAAAGTDPRTVRRFRVGARIGGVHADVGLARRRLAVEQKQQAGAGGILALGGMPQAEVADLVQIPWAGRAEGSGA